jgi:nitrogen-specific signal transduction histidine kinase
MTRNDIIRMAREAGLCDSSGEDDDSVNIARQLERFAALVAAAEREACARVVEDVEPSLSPIINMANRLAAAVIRARGQQQ